MKLIVSEAACILLERSFCFPTLSQFKRILPLPSENWSDFADIWFCHHHHHHPTTNGHNNTGNDNAQSGDFSKIESHCGENTIPENLKHVKNKGLLPRPDDCLVSSLYMMVSARHVNPNAIACSSDSLVCRRCGNFLGFVKLGGKKFFDSFFTHMCLIIYYYASFENYEIVRFCIDEL